MLGTDNNRKSIVISEEKRFCRSLQFSSDFPKQLSGIISPDEFQQSIASINRAGRLTLRENIYICSLYLCSLIGLLTFIAGIPVILLRISALWIPLMSIGFAIFMIFLTISIFGSSRVYRLCDTRTEKAVKAESVKYMTNLPVPTRWRLDMTIYARRISTGLPTDIRYFLLIDIGQRIDSEIKSDALKLNLKLSKPKLKTGQQYPTRLQSLPNLSAIKSSDITIHIEEQDRAQSLI